MDVDGVHSRLVGVFERGAPTYDRVGVDFFQPMGLELVRRAALRPGQGVLDAGCGRGAVLFPAAEAVEASGRVTGIDLAPSMVELTRAEAKAANLRQVDVRLGDAQSPGFPDGSFDAVLAGLVLFLLPSPTAALREYRRLLREGGRVAFSTLAAHDPRFAEAMQAVAAHLPADGRQPPTAAQDRLFATKEATAALLAEVGFGDVTVEDVSFESRFRDTEHWLRWAWSNGARMLFEQVPAEQLPTALAEASAVMTVPDGEIALRTTIRFAVGSVAAGR